MDFRELEGFLLQHRVVRNRVSPVDSLRAMTHHLHYRRERNASSLQVPDRRASKIMQ